MRTFSQIVLALLLIQNITGHAQESDKAGEMYLLPSSRFKFNVFPAGVVNQMELGYELQVNDRWSFQGTATGISLLPFWSPSWIGTAQLDAHYFMVSQPKVKFFLFGFTGYRHLYLNYAGEEGGPDNFDMAFIGIGGGFRCKMPRDWIFDVKIGKGLNWIAAPITSEEGALGMLPEASLLFGVPLKKKRASYQAW